MEINGEVNIEIDQYADVSFEIDTENLAETLCQDHNLVDDVVLHNYVDERMDDYELKVQIDDLDNKVDDLHYQVKGLISPEPDSDYSYVKTYVLDNYVRINDLQATIREAVDARLVELLTLLVKE